MNDLREPTGYEVMILMGLQQKPVYMGTVPPGVVAQRRAENRRARTSRRINRRSNR